MDHLDVVLFVDCEHVMVVEPVTPGPTTPGLGVRVSEWVWVKLPVTPTPVGGGLL